MEGLLEREVELAALEGAVGDAVEGRGSVLLVGGEAGIGKTSLVAALRRELRGRAACFLGACEPLSVPVPLAPVRELLEAAGGDGEVAGEDRLAIAGGLLGALAAHSPALAVVEDAHWADPSTLDVVRLAAPGIEERPLVLLLTYRSDEVGANPALQGLLGDWATRPFARRLSLRPLSDAAVRAMAEPAGLDPARLLATTGGNPFLVAEAVAAGEGLPASVRDAALARVGRLGPEARAAAESAAVVGGRLDPGLLEDLCPGGGEAAEEAIARGVMVAEAGVLGFRHELIREAIEDSIPPARRAALHRRAYEALAGRPHAADNARLAHHAEAGGLREEAVRRAVLAAAEAERLGALRETSLQAERALRLGAGLGAAERFELLLQQSRAANFASARLEDGAEPAEAALALARELGDPTLEGRALLTLASALWSLDRVADAREATERAIELLEPGEDRAALARAHAALVRMEATALDPRRAVAGGPRALELAAAAGLTETRIDIEISVGLALGHGGDPAALHLLAAASGEAREAGLAIQAVRSYVNRVYVAADLREHEAVDAAAAEALDLLDRYQATIPGHAIEIFRARSLLDRGRWQEALALAGHRDRRWAAETPLARTIEGLIGARRGDPELAARLEEAWQELRPLPEGSRHGRIAAALVEAAWLRGDDAAALAHLRSALASPVAERFARPAAELALWGRRLGLEPAPPPGAPEPVALELAGDWRGAIAAWRRLEAPYEAALAALPGD
ncbi:MAG TPA: AAA family ATPase, partial [Solirubrobacterales bacterium]